MRRKQMLIAFGTFMLTAFLASCMQKEILNMPVIEDYELSGNSAGKKNLKIGVVPGPYGNLYMEIIQPILAPLGYTAELIYYGDFIQPNFALANREGFSFTKADLEQYDKDLQASRKMSEEQLENVAGGVLRPPRPQEWLYISIQGFHCDPDLL